MVKGKPNYYGCTLRDFRPLSSLTSSCLLSRVRGLTTVSCMVLSETCSAENFSSVNLFWIWSTREWCLRVLVLIYLMDLMSLSWMTASRSGREESVLMVGLAKWNHLARLVLSNIITKLIKQILISKNNNEPKHLLFKYPISNGQLLSRCIKLAKVSR